MPSVTEVHHLADTCINTVAIFLNFVLLCVILKCSSSQMRAYRNVLLMTCISDISLNVVALIVQPAIFTKGTYVLAVSNGWFKGVYPFLDRAGVATFCSMVHTNIVLIVVQFMYRYRMLCLEEKARSSNWKLFAAAGFWCTLQALNAMWCFTTGVTEERQRTASEILRELGWGSNETPASYSTLNHASEFRIFLHHLIYFVSTLGGYSAIIWSHVKIGAFLKDRRQVMSPQTRRMQAQLTRMLTALAISPLLFITGPAAMTVVLIALQLSPGYMSAFVTVSMSLITVVNPLTTIFFVRPYRRAVIHAIGGKFTSGTVAPLSHTASDYALTEERRASMKI
ncbi:7TM GPCR protein [Aphelenchoides avenae]|nr:7TM GPCR protein [Aphelenchus avenae]